MRSLKMLTAALVMVASSAGAQNWVKFTEGATGFIDYFDAASIRRSGDEVQIWVLSDHSNDRTVPYTKAKRRYLVRCSASTAALEAYISYAKDGSVMESETIPVEKIEHAAMSPGSAGADLVEAACAKGTASTAPVLGAAAESAEWELRLSVTPIDGSPGFDASNTYKARAACEADLATMLAKATEMLGEAARSNGNCSPVVASLTSSVQKAAPARVGDARAATAKPTLAEKPSARASSGSQGSPALSLSCKGYWGLMKTNTSFVFHINDQAKQFTGTRDSIHDIAGKVGGKGDLMVLVFSDPTGMNYSAWIDRNSGSFKVDLSNDKLYLVNNISGSCQKFSGRAF